MVNTKITGLE